MQAITKLVADLTDNPVDLNEFVGPDGYLFARNGLGVAGRGVAMRGDSRTIQQALKTLNHKNSTDIAHAGPVAIGCIPFDSNSPHDFVIPNVVVGCSNSGQQWITIIDDASFNLCAQMGQQDSVAEFDITPGVSIEHYLEAVRLTRDAVSNGEFQKAVIARDLIITSNKEFDIYTILLRLRDRYRSSYRFIFEGFLGASPELLVSVDGETVSSHPLAGTTSRTGDPKVDDLLAQELINSTKNQLEHRIVIDMVHDTLLPWCSYLDWQPEPSIVEIANVAHLGTEISGRLSEPRPTVLELAYALSPTPALGGHPREIALQHIKRVEGFDRGRYGGAVGYFNAGGDGCFAVAIRCAEINNSDRTAHLFAGGGIVGDSDPLNELAETEAKFQAMLIAITNR